MCNVRGKKEKKQRSDAAQRERNAEMTGRT
jgi:hypothetical protein